MSMWPLWLTMLWILNSSGLWNFAEHIRHLYVSPNMILLSNIKLNLLPVGIAKIASYKPI